jgi:Fe-S-cluster containining protein
MSATRKDRRERERLESKVARRALPLFKDSPVRAPIRLRYAMSLAEGATPAKVLDGAHAEADAFAARVFARDAAPACAAGCSHCCEKMRVGVNATEARELATHLRLLPPEKLGPVRERIAANAARIKDTAIGTRPETTCALLGDDKRCGVYALRPFVCRRAHSFDADRCRRATAGEDVGITVDARVVGIYSEVATAFREASAAFGGDAESYELHHALDILLRDASGDLSPAREKSDVSATRKTEDALNAALRPKPSP